MTRRAQSGMSVIEMVVAMAVSSLVMVGVAGIIYTTNVAFGSWGARVARTSALGAVPARLSADAHRYVVCGDGASLSLCLAPAGAVPPVVTYELRGTCPGCDLVRSEWGGGARTTSQVVVRHLSAAPAFSHTCSSATASSGSITVRNLAIADPGSSSGPPQSVVVYFTGPGVCR